MTSDRASTDDSDERDGVSRREVLKASGLAAVADLEWVADTATTPTPSAAAAEALATRLPAPSRTPAGSYEVIGSRRLESSSLVAPALVGDADAHLSLVAPQATVTVGVGSTVDSDGLAAHGYRPATTPEGHQVFVREGRYRPRVAVAGDDAVVVGRGAASAPVAALVRAVATRRTVPLGERLPAAAAVLDRLGGGAVLSLTPAAGQAATEGWASVDGAPAPVATGERLTLLAAVPRVRSVAVYGSASAGATAHEQLTRAAGRANGTIARDGRALVVDTTVPGIDVPVTEP